MPQLVATVTGRTVDELRRARDAAAGADIVELRLDTMERPDARAALDGRLRPAIVTCRPRWEGGAFDGAEEDRRRVLLEAIKAGAEFVDVELHAPFAAELIRLRHGRGVVASTHIFGAPDGAYLSRFRALQASGAEVVKLAIEVGSLTDTLPLFELAADSAGDEPGRGHVLIAMGARGVHTRVLAARLGNRWSYAGDGVAPGQLPLAKLLSEFRFGRIKGNADLYGVVGDPVSRSLSPVMHNAGFDRCGINAAYLTFEARDADDFATFARAMGIRGGSVTAPFKVAMMRHVAECDAAARETGAINTIAVRNGRWIGFNTDVEGFLAPLKGRMALRGTRVSVLGAGGAARAVAVALKREGASATLSARRPEEARAVATLVGVGTGPFPPPPATWDVLVNATSSKASEASPMSGVALDGEIVFDLNYSPAETPLLRQARDCGCWTIGGIEMLIAQAERQFEIWTGAPPPRDLFKQAVDAIPSWQTGVRA